MMATNLYMLYEMVLRDDCYMQTFDNKILLILAEPKFCIGHVLIEDNNLIIIVPTKQVLERAGL